MEQGEGADETPESLQREALALIASTGLEEVLKASFGDFALVGSAALNLMSWRDLDLYVPVERGGAQAFIDVLAPIYAALTSKGHTVFRITFNDEWALPRGRYGSGYYWGIRVRTAPKAVWKIDLWGWDRRTFEQKLDEQRQLEHALEGADRALILDLKRQAQKLTGFRKEVTSWDIYQFALSGEGKTLDQLLSFCLARRAPFA